MLRVSVASSMGHLALLAARCIGTDVRLGDAVADGPGDEALLVRIRLAIGVRVAASHVYFEGMFCDFREACFELIPDTSRVLEAELFRDFLGGCQLGGLVCIWSTSFRVSLLPSTFQFVVIHIIADIGYFELAVLALLAATSTEIAKCPPPLEGAQAPSAASLRGNVCNTSVYSWIYW